MSFKIIVDSCCDLTAAQFHAGPFLRVPLTLSLAGEDIVDDDTFDQTHLLWLMREDPDPPKTACPSPAPELDAVAAAEAQGQHPHFQLLLRRRRRGGVGHQAAGAGL